MVKPAESQLLFELFERHRAITAGVQLPEHISDPVHALETGDEGRGTRIKHAEGSLIDPPSYGMSPTWCI